MNKQDIITKVTEYFDVSFETINSSRERDNMAIKKMIWKILKEDLKLSYANCGDGFSGASHCNVLTTLKVFNGYIDTDTKLSSTYEDLKEYIFSAKKWRKKKLISEIKSLYGDTVANNFIEITDDTELLNLEEWE